MPPSSFTIADILIYLPAIVLLISAGISWGVTTATVKVVKLDLGVIAKDFSNWKENRKTSVVTFPDCTAMRRRCSDANTSAITALIERLDKYIEKSDERWLQLMLIINKRGHKEEKDVT